MAQQIKFGDKLLLKGETLILDNGTSHGQLESNNGTIWIKGDLLVDGATTTINTEEINLADNNILINSNHTGVPTHDGGITINRGTSDDAIIQWNETTDKWEAKEGTTYATVKADTFEGNSTGIHTGNVTGNLTGNSTGEHTGAVIGNVTGTVSSIANHDTDDLAEGSTNLYYTQTRVDARYATLHANANADTLDNLDGTYYLDYNNFTGTPGTDLVTDLTPQLGGNLDLNTFDLTTSDAIVTLTTSDSSPTASNVATTSSSEILLSNTTVTFSEDTDLANATSSYATISSTNITTLGFKGDVSLTYFSIAPSTSNFVWRDVSDSAEQNNMVTTYLSSADEYTFTLPTDASFPINSLDNDIYFKQYAYSELSLTSSTPLTTSNVLLRDSNGFFIDTDHVTITNTGGTTYKIVFWTHPVAVGDLIDVLPGAAQSIFSWGSATSSTFTAEGFDMTSSSNDIVAMGDLNFTSGLLSGTEIVGSFFYDSPSNLQMNHGMMTGAALNGSSIIAGVTVTDAPLLLWGNGGSVNEVGLAVGTNTDGRIHVLNSSSNTIYKFPLTDGTANQVLQTDGYGDLSWTTSTNTDTTYTGGTGIDLTGTVFSADSTMATKAYADAAVAVLTSGASATHDTLLEIQNLMATDSELSSAISGLNHDALAGFVANEHIDWSSASAGTIHASNYTDTNTTYTAGTNVTISGANVISATDTNTDTTYTAGTNISISGANVISSTSSSSYGDSDVASYLFGNLDTHILPDTNNTYDIGSASFKIRDLYVSDNSLHIGNNTLRTSGSNLLLNGEDVMDYNNVKNKPTTLSGYGITDGVTDITGSIIPATDNTYDLGSSAKKYKQIYGYTVEATFADLAERYATDVPYEVATVVVFGGEAEITTTTAPGDVSVAGVISTNPAVRMNAEAGNSETHPYVALKGRVPCKMIGPVSKGDLIVTADNEPGYAQSIGKNDAGRSVFAKSIETDLTEGKKVIEVSIL
jgi:hypothetical protein